jgi:3-isopropylmalate/(R)-2-methylmalate dehydratase small subunit
MKADIAESFARMLYRNAINSGLPIVGCADAADVLKERGRLSIDFAESKIKTP